MNRARAYRDCAVAGATPIGLMVALFDRLALDLRRAAEAIRANDIEVRCREMNHAFRILGQLESWIDLQNGGEPARQISRFYAQVRSAMIQASFRQSAEVIEGHIQTILRIRSNWQELDLQTRERPAGTDSVTPYPALEGVTRTERVSLSISA